MRVYFRYQEKEYQSGEAFDAFANSIIHTYFEKMKYKIMWSLRSLEKQIDAWRGVIIVDENEFIEMRGFPEELSDKMYELIRIEFGREMEP